MIEILNEKYDFPKTIKHVLIPPIKCQGIKSQLVSFIASNIKWKGKGVWYDPFMGSGAVTLNLKPKHAILSDINPHIINFYNDIKSRKITPQTAKEFLEYHGEKLSKTNDSTDSYYYTMRDQFNENHNSLHFLFLIRSCFNGLMRFNSKGNYNAAFGRNPNRFSKAYITKIYNQIKWVQELLSIKNYQFICCDWKNALQNVNENDFVYFDPPYLGRLDTYFDKWNEDKNNELTNWIKNSKCGWALSSWYQVRDRKNTLIDETWSDYIIRENEHFYFIGPKTTMRPNVTEALIIENNHAYDENMIIENKKYKTLNSFLDVNKKN